MEDLSLYEKLHIYGESDYYPYHMPGHKRNQLGRLSKELLNADITEIEGFDNLHQAEGILRELQGKAAALYGAEETFYLVNGSTCGILSAVSAALPEGGHLLMARDSHRSVYHAAYLRGLRTSYLYAEPVKGFSFHEALTPEQVEEALERERDIGAVLIVSPTYEGRIAEVGVISEIVHKKGIPLIVDEAHGAHLGFAKGFARSSCTQGADLVVQSVHKTLPAMTQTALLHVNGKLIDRDRLRRFLHIYQSSSPSYVLMASIGDAMEIVEKQGAERFGCFRERYRALVERLQNCRHFKFVPWRDVKQGRQDIGKLVIASKEDGVSGQWIYDELLEHYHLQCEMAAGNYCLAMFTLADGPEAYRRMGDALSEMDGRIARRMIKEPISIASGGCQQDKAYQESVACRRTGAAEEMWCRVLPGADGYVPLKKAWDMPWEMTRLSDAVNRPVGEFIQLYPPGIPLLVPGEILTRELYEQIQEMAEQGLNIQGIAK